MDNFVLYIYRSLVMIHNKKKSESSGVYKDRDKGLHMEYLCLFE